MAAVIRRTARVVPVDGSYRVLVLRGEDQEDRPHWFTIGGALEADETPEQAAARELLEETGIRVRPGQLGSPYFVGRHEFIYNGIAYLSDASFFAYKADPDQQLTFVGVEPGEVIVDARWVDPEVFTEGSDSTPPLRRLLLAAVRHLRK